VYEDCNAVVSSVTLGGGVTRTKHLRARMHLGKEMVEEGRIRVIYKKGEEMLVDGMSKPYDPVKHKPFALELLGGQESVNGWALEYMDTKKKSDEEREQV
jgi:phosphoribosylformimino-5-aminoimidazole carboxamide ribonucleotide (ProFAR) isomerase